MGVFSDHVKRYYDFGIVTIPCKNKVPSLGEGWQLYCKSAPSEVIVDTWEKKFTGSTQLGLTLGPANGLVAFDFDYEFGPKCTVKEKDFRKDRALVESQIIALLPQTPCIKTGRKGWTRIYKIAGEMTNETCDRNGVRLFDFLASGRQTIIPPSIYNESDPGGIKYEWMGPPIDACLDDIPVLDMDVVLQLKTMFQDSAGYNFLANGRHGILLRWLLDVVRLEKNDTVVAEKLVLRDIALNAVPYLSDAKHFDARKTALDNALPWVKRVRRFVGVLPKQIQFSEAGWDYFFDHSFSVIRKDIISKNCFFKLKPSMDWGLMAEVEGVLRSYANKKGLPFSRVNDELERWTLEKTECDFLCDIPPWDGVDRVSLFGGAIKSPDFSGDEISEILKHWGSNIFRRVKSANNQNRCIILKGPQGAGKDYLVRSMLDGFKPYYESTTMPGTQKDALEICSRLLAVHIEEFDQTKNMDVAFLKSLITQPSAFFRESYGTSPNQKMMRPSFISTANVDDILRDPTGNRRFIVIPVDGISWTYPKDQSIMIMSQFKAAFEADMYTTLSDQLEAKIKAIVDGLTPEDISVSIVDIYCQKYHALVGKNGVYPGARFLLGKEIAIMLSDVARLSQTRMRHVQSAVKHAGLSHKYRDGVHYYKSKDDALQAMAKRVASDQAENNKSEPPITENLSQNRDINTV